MNWVLWIYAISALASALAAVLAWAAKLWWAKEYAAAKDETIKAKDAQIASLKSSIENIQVLSSETAKAKDAQIETLKNEIQNLRELTPMKIREYFLSVKEQLEEYNGKLQEELASAYEEVKKKDGEIRRLFETHHGWPGGPDDTVPAKLQSLMRDLEAKREQLEMKASTIKQELQKEEERRRNFEILLSWLDQTRVEEAQG